MYRRHMTNISVDDWRLPAVVAPDADNPTLAEVDVLVVGAGRPASPQPRWRRKPAERAARREVRVRGGAAVAGMSGTICGMYLATDAGSSPEQVVLVSPSVSGDLAERGGLTAPQRYGKTLTAAHDPLVWREAADALLTGAGVRMLFHTAVIGVLVDGWRTTEGCVVESNAGSVVDTGRAHHRRLRRRRGRGPRRAALPVRRRRAYPEPDHVLPDRQRRDVDGFWAATATTPSARREVTASDPPGRARAALDLPRHKIWIFPTTRPGELMVNATRLTAPTAGCSTSSTLPISPTPRSAAVNRSGTTPAFSPTPCPDARTRYVVDTGVEAGIRQTRTIAAVQTLTRQRRRRSGRKRPDSASRASPGRSNCTTASKPKLHWLARRLLRGPLPTLVPEAGENVIVAGRCLSAEHQALASARVTAQCFEYGHAAAVATVLSLTPAWRTATSTCGTSDPHDRQRKCARVRRTLSQRIRKGRNRDRQLRA